METSSHKVFQVFSLLYSGCTLSRTLCSVALHSECVLSSQIQHHLCSDTSLQGNGGQYENIHLRISWPTGHSYAAMTPLGISGLRLVLGQGIAHSIFQFYPDPKETGKLCVDGRVLYIFPSL